VEWGWGGGEERGPGGWETVITWEWFVAAPARAHPPITPSPATHTHVREGWTACVDLTVLSQFILEWSSRRTDEGAHLDLFQALQVRRLEQTARWRQRVPARNHLCATASLEVYGERKERKK